MSFTEKPESVGSSAGHRLTDEQIAQFRTEGWVSPIDVLSTGEAADLLARLTLAEAEHPGALAAENRNNAHLSFPFLADLALDERITDAAASLVGPDMTLWSSVLFIKDGGTGSFVSWHQDAKYMALAPDNFVTAWIALSPSTAESGCVAVIPRSHTDGALPHDDTYGADNILTRGQQVAGVDETTAVNLELQPGQMSLHHPWLIHGSHPNRSTQRRVGVAMQSYLGGDVRPVKGEHHVMHVTGQPVPAGFVEAPRPESVCAPPAVKARAAANHAFADVLYDGAAQRRPL